MTPTTEASQGRLNKANEGLVPHLAAAFSLKGLSQINLDPIVLAVACHVKSKQKGVKPVVTIDEMIIKGSSWFPQRTIHSRKQEADRLARFARTYPTVFSLESSRDSVSLTSGALFQGSPDPCDEAWYHIVLHRLLPQDMLIINEVLDDLEVKGLTHTHIPHHVPSYSHIVSLHRCMSRAFKEDTFPWKLPDEMTIVTVRYNN